MNVTQAAVSQWLSGRRSTPADVQEILRQLVRAWSAETVLLGSDPLGRNITAPVENWSPVFRPHGRFRLGIHLNWSGSASTRCFEAEDPGDVLESYSLVLTNGTAPTLAPGSTLSFLRGSYRCFESATSDVPRGQHIWSTSATPSQTSTPKPADLVPLSRGQQRAAAILLSASGSRMALGGGGALIAHGLVDRDSGDLDAFIDTREDFESVTSRVRAAFQGANYEVSDNESLGDPSQIQTWFVRPRKTATRGRPTLPVKIQLLRHPILLDPVPGQYGPMIDPVELGAQKLTVIYEDARPRDYDGLARITTHYRLDRIIEVADKRHFQPLDRPTIAATLRQVAHMRATDIPEGCGLQALVTYYDSVADPSPPATSAQASSLPTPYSAQWQPPETSAHGPPTDESAAELADLQRFLLLLPRQR